MVSSDKMQSFLVLGAACQPGNVDQNIFFINSEIMSPEQCPAEDQREIAQD